MERVIVREILPSHPRLGRNVNHDSASRAFRVAPVRSTAQLGAVRHETHIPIMDQGSTGSCTGNSGVAAIYRAPFVSGVVKPWHYQASNDGAVRLYSDATAVDPFLGTYPPDDTGSDGLSIARVLKDKGIISGYLWAFTTLEALGALMKAPVITGVPWYNSMFDTTDEGHRGHVRVDKASGVAGGHEVCVDEIIPVGADVMDWFVGGPNSWGTSWGDNGRWYWTVREWDWLLSQRGDVTAFVANTKPAPEPTPTPETGDPAGDRLWKATQGWAAARHTGSNAKAAAAVRHWAKETGRS